MESTNNISQDKTPDLEKKKKGQSTLTDVLDEMRHEVDQKLTLEKKQSQKQDLIG